MEHEPATGAQIRDGFEHTPTECGDGSCGCRCPTCLSMRIRRLESLLDTVVGLLSSGKRVPTSDELLEWLRTTDYELAPWAVESGYGPWAVTTQQGPHVDPDLIGKGNSPYEALLAAVAVDPVWAIQQNERDST